MECEFNVDGEYKILLLFFGGSCDPPGQIYHKMALLKRASGPTLQGRVTRLRTILVVQCYFLDFCTT